MEWYTFTEQPYLVRSSVDGEFELSEEVIHRLPKYGGAFREDPMPFLKWFNIYCIAVKPFGVDMDEFKFRIFPFSLTDSANDWFSYLSPHVFRTWETMEEAFLAKYSIDVQEERMEEILGQLAQTIHQNKERTDKAIAEMSKQISQISEALLERQGNDENLPSQTIPNTRSDVNDVALRNGRDLDAERTNLITGEEQIISANEEEEGTPNPSLPALVTSSLAPMVKPALTKSSPAHIDSHSACSKVPNITNNEINVPNIPLPFSVHRNSPTKQVLNEETFGEEFFLFFLKNRKRHSTYGWKPGWIPERSAYGATNKRVKINWRSRMKAKRKPVKEEVSSYGVLMRMRHSNYLWKPGWDFWRSVRCIPNKRVKRSCNKFDGVHPWAPNL